MTATDISELIKRSVDSSEAEEGLYGGSIVVLVALYDDLLEKRKGEISSESGHNFTLNMLESASVMQDSVIGWNEIHNHFIRYQTSSNILTFIDNLGLLYTSEVPCSDKMEVFQTENIRLIVRTSVAIEETTCFSSSDQQNVICFPHSALQFSRLNCTTFVSSFYSERNERSQMFPNYISNETSAEDTSSLHHHLIGLSVDNQTVRLEGSEGSLIRLEFTHPDPDLTGAGAVRDCVWWDTAGLAWSRAGCEVSEEDSTASMTVCHCDHLTNFGVMFDYRGQADPQDPVFTLLSTVLLSLSALSILVTQAFLALTK